MKQCTVGKPDSITQRHFPFQFYAVHSRNYLKGTYQEKKMSSASGDEVDIALAEPGERENNLDLSIELVKLSDYREIIRLLKMHVSRRNRPAFSIAIMAKWRPYTQNDINI
jgi:hypothetical protein